MDAASSPLTSLVPLESLADSSVLRQLQTPPTPLLSVLVVGGEQWVGLVGKVLEKAARAGFEVVGIAMEAASCEEAPCSSSSSSSSEVQSCAASLLSAQAPLPPPGAPPSAGCVSAEG